MSAKLSRAARRERQAAKAVGSVRVVREVGESAPDVVPSVLPTGLPIVTEVKSRENPLRVVARWLAQAENYAPGRAPVLFVYALGQHADDALVVMRAGDWKRAVGLAATPAQGALALTVKP